MQRPEFEDKLRHFIRMEPFEPFVVEMLDGRAIRIERPAVAFDGGGAVYATEDLELIDFHCQQVHSIFPARAETVP